VGRAWRLRGPVRPSLPYSEKAACTFEFAPPNIGAAVAPSEALGWQSRPIVAERYHNSTLQAIVVRATSRRGRG